MSLSLPGIIKDMGYNRSRAQLMTIPIYAAASVIAIIVSLVSDRFGRRSPFVLGCLFLTLVGFAMYVPLRPALLSTLLTSLRCVGSADNSVVYAGLVLAACGMFPATPGMITWLANNLGGSYKRSVGMAIQISAGNLGGAMAANFYRRKDSPRYILWHSLSLGFVVGGIIATVILIIAYRAINKKREEAMLAGRRSQYTEAELSFKGDKAITWRYMH
jgi:MFS family permease